MHSSDKNLGSSPSDPTKRRPDPSERNAAITETRAKSTALEIERKPKNTQKQLPIKKPKVRLPKRLARPRTAHRMRSNLLSAFAWPSMVPLTHTVNNAEANPASGNTRKDHRKLLRVCGI